MSSKIRNYNTQKKRLLTLIVADFMHVLAGRAGDTVTLTRGAERPVLARNTIAIRIVIVGIIRVIDNKVVGRTKLALEIKRFSVVLVSSSAANLTIFCWRRVLVCNWTVFAVLQLIVLRCDSGSVD